MVNILINHTSPDIEIHLGRMAEESMWERGSTEVVTNKVRLQ